MYSLNESHLDQVAGGTPVVGPQANNPLFDAPISAIYSNYRNAGASISSALLQTGMRTGGWITAAGAGGWMVGSAVYDVLPRNIQDDIGRTVSFFVGAVGDFLNHNH